MVKVGYIGSSDLSVIGTSLRRSGEVIKAVGHSSGVCKVHVVWAWSGVMIIIGDCEGEATECLDAFASDCVMAEVVVVCPTGCTS